MTHDELIEVVAKAIGETETHDGTGTLADHVYQSELPDMARAAIRVIAPAVLEDVAALEESRSWSVGLKAHEIRAMKTRYEQ